ncbi:MAG: hypothetical protein EOM10_16745 [Opitutae bacterium]|nr:hypothetical protein [Opitutae bacterium]
MFRDRVDAGRRLARALEKYRGRGALVLAIPRGGAVVGDEVPRHLGANFSLIVSRKLPFPDTPESGFGAIAEDGSVFIHEAAARWVTREAAEEIARAQRREIGGIQHDAAAGRDEQPVPGAQFRGQKAQLFLTPKIVTIHNAQNLQRLARQTRPRGADLSVAVENLIQGCRPQ